MTRRSDTKPRPAPGWWRGLPGRGQPSGSDASKSRPTRVRPLPRVQETLPVPSMKGRNRGRWRLISATARLRERLAEGHTVGCACHGCLRDRKIVAHWGRLSDVVPYG